jgi:hypothetical protein
MREKKMSQILTISDDLYAHLEAAAQRRGLSSVQQLLETWHASEEALSRFHVLAEQWKKETAHYSNVARKAMHPAYQEIIGMGKAVVPLLLAELKREPDDWFWALHALIRANPVPPQDRGNLHAMADAWLRWGAVQREDSTRDKI